MSEEENTEENNFMEFKQTINEYNSHLQRYNLLRACEQSRELSEQGFNQIKKQCIDDILNLDLDLKACEESERIYNEIEKRYQEQKDNIQNISDSELKELIEHIKDNLDKICITEYWKKAFHHLSRCEERGRYYHNIKTEPYDTKHPKKQYSYDDFLAKRKVFANENNHLETKT